jgi:hypothetical protein
MRTSYWNMKIKYVCDTGRGAPNTDGCTISVYRINKICYRLLQTAWTNKSLVYYVVCTNVPLNSVLRFLYHTTSRTPLDNGSARLRGHYLHYTQHTKETIIHAIDGIRARDLGNRVDAQLRLRLRSHRGPASSFAKSAQNLTVCSWQRSRLRTQDRPVLSSESKPQASDCPGQASVRHQRTESDCQLQSDVHLVTATDWSAIDEVRTSYSTHIALPFPIRSRW